MDLPKGSVVVFDKGYNCYRWHNRLTEQDIFFVSRIRANAKYRVTERRAVNKSSGVTSDQTIEYKAHRKDGDKLKPIRRVGYTAILKRANTMSLSPTSSTGQRRLLPISTSSAGR